MGRKGLFQSALHEVYHNPPRTLKYSPKSKKGRRQLLAIAYSKARRGKL